MITSQGIIYDDLWKCPNIDVYGSYIMFLELEPKNNQIEILRIYMCCSVLRINIVIFLNSAPENYDELTR